MSIITTVLEADKRPILYAEFLPPEECAPCWTTHDGPDKSCDEIQAYNENGEMGPVPWLAIIKGGEIIARLPARFCEIGYTPTPETP